MINVLSVPINNELTSPLCQNTSSWSSMGMRSHDVSDLLRPLDKDLTYDSCFKEQMSPCKIANLKNENMILKDLYFPQQPNPSNQE